MPARAKFTQSDVTRAVKGWEAAGKVAAQVVIEPDGRITVSGSASLAIFGANPLDRVFVRDRV